MKCRLMRVIMSSAIGLALVWCAHGPVGSACAQTTRSWRTATSGNWGVNANWSPQTAFPNNGANSYSARILLTTSSYTVTLNQPITVSSARLESNTATLALTNQPLTSLGTLTLFGGTISGQSGGSLAVGGTFTFQDLNGAGAFLVGPYGVLTTGPVVFNSALAGVDICDTDINHSGPSVSWTGNGDLRFDAGANFTNGLSSVFIISNDRSMIGSGLPVPAFSNLGTLTKSGTGGTTTITGIDFVNSGLVTVSTGTLTIVGFEAPGGTLSGNWTVDNGATLNLLDDMSNPLAVTNIDGTVSLIGAGSTFGAINSLTIIDANGSLLLDDGRDLATSGSMSSDGDITINSGDVDPATLTVTGALTQNDGFVTLGDATISTTGGYTIGTPATLKGTGTVIGSLVNNGKIDPGFSPGTLTVQGPFVQSSQGRLVIEIGPDTGEQSLDMLIVEGAASIHGQLEIRVLPGFTLQPHQTFDILQSAQRIGTFEVVNGPLLPTGGQNGGRFGLQYLSTGVRLISPATVTGGACCLPDGSCVHTATAAGCSTAGGMFQGFGVVCTEGLCPDPTGACCTPSGSCIQASSTACQLTGGTYQGDLTLCNGAIVCPPPTGACCFQNRSCIIASRDTCVGQGGNYNGDFSVCDAETCGPDGLAEIRVDPDPQQSQVVIDGIISPDEYGPGNAQVFTGGGNSAGGALGEGALYMDRDDQFLYIAFQPATTMSDVVFIMLDTVAGSGQTDASMTDTANFRRRVLANMTRDNPDIFPAGFAPEFGLTIHSAGIHLFRLTPPDNFILEETSTLFTGTGATVREIAIPLTDMDNPGVIDLFAGYSRTDNFMSDEAIPAQPFSFGGSIGTALPADGDSTFVDWRRFDRFIPGCTATLSATAILNQSLSSGSHTAMFDVGERLNVQNVRARIRLHHSAVGNLTGTLRYSNAAGIVRSAPLFRRVNSSATGGGAGPAGDQSDLADSPATTLLPGTYEFKDDAAMTLWSAAVNTPDAATIPVGAYRPSTTSNRPVSLAETFGGMCSQGVWTVTVSDDFAASGSGLLASITLIIDGNACEACGDGLGACCMTRCECIVLTEDECTDAGGAFAGVGTSCAASDVCEGSTACPCEWNGMGAVDSQDYFDFMDDFFAGNADYNCDGITDSQDFFDFLNCFFGSDCSAS